MRFNDLTGKKFGKLTVIGRAPSKVDASGKARTMWYCICDCKNPNTIVVFGDYLKRSECPSCGCETHKNRVEKKSG